MSDNVTVVNQLPTPCDFGPFASGACGKKINLTYMLETSDISSLPIDINIEEGTTTINIDDFVSSTLPINYASLLFDPAITDGVISNVGNLITYIPNETININRTINSVYKIKDGIGKETSNTIKLNITDTTKLLTSTPVVLSGLESNNYVIDINTLVTARNIAVDLSTLTVTNPSEGTVTISGSKITYVPNTSSNVARTVVFNYSIKDSSGTKTTTNTISITLADNAPSVTATNFSITLKDSATNATNITGKITIKNDTFKSVVCTNPSEGLITISGSTVTFTPNSVVTGNRTVTTDYTVTTTSGLTATGKITYTITDDNIWTDTIWYGNSTLTDMTKDGIVALAGTIRQADFPGQYSIPAGTSVYKWVCYPAAWGEPLAILDPATQMEIATIYPYQIVNVDGIDMMCIRTFYKINVALTYKLV